MTISVNQADASIRNDKAAFAYAGLKSISMFWCTMSMQQSRSGPRQPVSTNDDADIDADV